MKLNMATMKTMATGDDEDKGDNDTGSGTTGYDDDNDGDGATGDEVDDDGNNDDYGNG
jgi:hypothetical protein